jgi:hypothetical protein
MNIFALKSILGLEIGWKNRKWKIEFLLKSLKIGLN